VWILNFIPDFIFHLLFITSLLILCFSFVLDSIPFISTNAKAIQLASAVVLAISLFFEGAISNDGAWQSRVKELELKVVKTEVLSAEANGELKSKIAQKDKEIALVQQQVKNRIKDVAVAIDNECKVPVTVIDILNDSAQTSKVKK
jgi:hypothetical protein